MCGELLISLENQQFATHRWLFSIGRGPAERGLVEATACCGPWAPDAIRRTCASVPAGCAVWSFRVVLYAPTVDHLGVETPIGADPKGRDLSATKQLVYRRWMHTQILRQILDRHHARHAVLGFNSHDISRLCKPLILPSSLV